MSFVLSTKFAKTEYSNYSHTLLSTWNWNMIDNLYHMAIKSANQIMFYTVFTLITTAWENRKIWNWTVFLGIEIYTWTIKVKIGKIKKFWFLQLTLSWNISVLEIGSHQVVIQTPRTCDKLPDFILIWRG